MKKKTAWDEIKAFAIELVKKKTKAQQDLCRVTPLLFLSCFKLSFELVKKSLRSK